MARNPRLEDPDAVETSKAKYLNRSPPSRPRPRSSAHSNMCLWRENVLNGSAKTLELASPAVPPLCCSQHDRKKAYRVPGTPF